MPSVHEELYSMEQQKLGTIFRHQFQFGGHSVGMLIALNTQHHTCVYKVSSVSLRLHRIVSRVHQLITFACYSKACMHPLKAVEKLGSMYVVLCNLYIYNFSYNKLRT